MDIKTLMTDLGYSDVTLNENAQFQKTYTKQLLQETGATITGWNKKTFLVTLELCEEDYNNFDPSAFRRDVELKGQSCKFIDETVGQDNKRNILFEISVLKIVCKTEA